MSTQQNQRWEDISEKMDSMKMSEPEKPKPTFNFNLSAKPYVPPEVETVQKPLIPKVTKKSEELENNRNKIVNKAKESKETVNIVFIGHVDAGKSTIGGHILYLTGMVDKRTLEKYEKEAKEKNRESWFFSWALDTNAEERDKGKTVEIGKAYFETAHKKFILLDAPGHRAYVPNMINGTAQADVAILVISARSGEFETGFDKGGQTREHAQIARISNIKHLIILVNKMDDPTVNWKKSRYDEIVERLGAYLKKSWKPQELYFLPCSGLTGINLKDRGIDWFQGQSLLEYLDNLPSINVEISGNPMIIVTDRYKDMGTVLACKVISGVFGKSDVFTMSPISRNVKILNIMNLDDEEIEIAKIGENIKIRLSGVDDCEILAGFVMSVNSCPVAKMFDAHLVVTDCKNLIAIGYKAVIHVQNAIDEVSLVAVKKVMDPKTGEWMDKTLPFIKQGNVCVVKMCLSNLQCIAAHTQIPYLSRFSIRDEGKTVAFGKILKIYPPK